MIKITMKNQIECNKPTMPDHTLNCIAICAIPQPINTKLGNKGANILFKTDGTIQQVSLQAK